MFTHTRRFVVLVLAPMMLTMMSACLEYETTTTVHPDGSFTRSLIVTGDSAALAGWRFNIPADPTWTIRDMTRLEEKKWRMTAERTFPSSDSWDTWRDSLDRRVLDCTVQVERQFRFFTTRYRFTETIRSFNPFTLIPITDFISPSELDMFLRFEVLKEQYPSRGDSLAFDDAGDRFEEWETRTRTESIFRVIEEHLEPSSGPDASRRADLKESLVMYFMNDGREKNFSLDGLKTWADSVGEPAILHAIREGESELQKLEKDVHFVNAVGADAYITRVQLPGEIISSNGTLDGPSRVSWDNYIAYAYVADFTMHAESSVVNVWAIVLTLGVIVGVPILVWIARTRREKLG